MPRGIRSDLIRWFETMFADIRAHEATTIPEWYIDGVIIRGVKREFFEEVIAPRIPEGTAVNFSSDDVVEILFSYCEFDVVNDSWWRVTEELQEACRLESSRRRGGT